MIAEPIPQVPKTRAYVRQPLLEKNTRLKQAKKRAGTADAKTNPKLIKKEKPQTISDPYSLGLSLGQTPERTRNKATRTPGSLGASEQLKFSETLKRTNNYLTNLDNFLEQNPFQTIQIKESKKRKISRPKSQISGGKKLPSQRNFDHYDLADIRIGLGPTDETMSSNLNYAKKTSVKIYKKNVKVS